MEKGFDKRAVVNFYTLIDWIIGLSKELELEYLDDVYKFEQSKKMPYITSAERLKKELSHRIGRQEGHKAGLPIHYILWIFATEPFPDPSEPTYPINELGTKPCSI